MEIAIRAEGGQRIGYGHLVRTGALAEELLGRGIDVTYATTTPEAVREVCPPDVQTIDLHHRGDPEPFLKWIKDERPDIVVTDAYPIDTSYQGAVRTLVPSVVIQDDARHTINADVFVNGNINAGRLDYEFVEPRPVIYLGPKYILLRSKVRELAKSDPPWHEVAQRAIITMGGSDPANLTPDIVTAFDGMGICVDAIIGPGFSARQERAVRDAASHVSADVTVVRNPKDLTYRMFRADIGVSTASSTIYELFALGTPVVCCEVADNQHHIAKAVRQYDMATVLRRGAGVASFRRGIKNYVSNTKLRKERRQWARDLIDGCGTKRVAKAITRAV